MTTLYHLTSRSNLRNILAEGFRDSGYRSRAGHAGVRFCDRRGALSMTGALAAVEVEVLLSDEELSAFEWVDGTSGQREFVIPAKRVNDHCLLHVISEAEARALALSSALR